MNIISSKCINHKLPVFESGIFHELGHMHEAPNKGKRTKCAAGYDSKGGDAKLMELEKDNENQNCYVVALGEHCLNKGCSMRQRMVFDHWDCHLTKEREPGKPYCDKCLSDIRDYCSEKGI